MTISCEIVFVRNPTKVFYLGQPLRGYVHLAVKSQQDVHGIHVKLSGVAVANWKIGRAIRRCTEDCLNHQISIIGMTEICGFVTFGRKNSKQCDFFKSFFLGEITGNSQCFENKITVFQLKTVLTMILNKPAFLTTKSLL